MGAWGDGSSVETRTDERDSPRERILDAADRLFTLGGVRGTGVNALIASADVAKATFYRHFPSKDTLIVTWLTLRAPRWFDDVLAATGGRALAPSERLDVFIEAFLDRVLHHDLGSFPFLETALEARDLSPEVRGAITAYLVELRGSLASLAADAGAADPDGAAEQLRLLLLGVIASGRALPHEDASVRVATQRMARSIIVGS